MIHLPTPKLDHLSQKDYENIYEPSEDTFILLDAIEKDIKLINQIKPLMCLEVGSGSGCVSTFFGQLLNSQCFIICTDINNLASKATFKTGRENNVALEVVTTDLVEGLFQRLENNIDILLFNPPYVCTEHLEILNSIEMSWSGGTDGCQIMRRLFPHVQNLLSKNGLFYLVVIENNKPKELIKELSLLGLNGETVLKRRCGIEILSVLRFNKN